MGSKLFSIKVYRHCIESIKVIKLVNEVIRYTPLGKYCRNGPMNKYPAHRADMNTPRDRLFVAY